MLNINTAFCCTLLSMVMEDVRKVTTKEQRGDAWSYQCMPGHWEFHGPDGFYWHGSADNAYHARAQGWSSWLSKQSKKK